MGWKLDVKSAVVGGVVVAVAALFLGAGKSEPMLNRYQISAAGAAQSGFKAYVVDTMTGKVWFEGERGFIEAKTDDAK